jgi:hypothetical protein
LLSEQYYSLALLSIILLIASKAVIAITPCSIITINLSQSSGPWYRASFKLKFKSKVGKHTVQENLPAGFIRTKVGSTQNTALNKRGRIYRPYLIMYLQPVAPCASYFDYRFSRYHVMCGAMWRTRQPRFWFWRSCDSWFSVEDQLF